MPAVDGIEAGCYGVDELPSESDMHSPLADFQPPHALGVFGARRRHDVHTGVDLYCEDGAPVYAMTPGTVARVVPFTGPSMGTPWWHETVAIIVETSIGFILYGEVESKVKEGDVVEEGDVIGSVVRVLRKDKGLPTTMLHVELYDLQAPVYESSFESAVWGLDEPQPQYLLDPTPLLNEATQLRVAVHS